MRIVDITEEVREGWKALEATVVWERGKREPQEIRYTIPEAYGHLASRTPDPFVCAGVMAAAYNLEPRLEVEEPMCPTLVDGAQAAMQHQQRARRDFSPIPIEGPTTNGPRTPIASPTSAMMFSGGIDSLATLLANREKHSPDDEGYFRYGIVLSSGFDVFEIEPGSWYWRKLEKMAQAANIELIPVATNAREMQPADHFFLNYFFGPLLASLGHFLSAGISRVAIGSAGSEDRSLHGSHPDLDPLFSSGAVEIIHDLSDATRFAKTRKVADWPAAHHRVRFCLYPPRSADRLNCGRCEKCLRTMLSLLALDRLDVTTFDLLDTSIEYLERSLEFNWSSRTYYPEIADALHEAGYYEHESVVREKLAAVRMEEGLSGWLSHFDRKYLGGTVRRIKRRLTR